MNNESISEVRRANLNAYCIKRGWISQRNPNQGSPTELSKRLGRGPAFWSNVLRDPKKSFGASLARFIEENLDLPKYSLDGDEESAEFLSVKMLSIDVSAGSGKVAPPIIEELGELQFRRDFLRNAGVSITNAAVVHVRGSSMEPTIYDGSVILINRADTAPRHNFIYAFRFEDTLHVKRFFKENDYWIARSDNPDREENPDIVINEQTPCTIIGRAIWMGTKL